MFFDGGQVLLLQHFYDKTVFLVLWKFAFKTRARLVGTTFALPERKQLQTLTHYCKNIMPEQSWKSRANIISSFWMPYVLEVTVRAVKMIMVCHTAYWWIIIGKGNNYVLSPEKVWDGEFWKTLGVTESRNTSKNTGSKDLMRNSGEDIELIWRPALGLERVFDLKRLMKVGS